MSDNQVIPEAAVEDHNCPECHVRNDHTWWCKVAPMILPDGTRPYYWRG